MRKGSWGLGALVGVAACSLVLDGCTETVTEPAVPAARVAALYERPPGMSSCDEGVLKMSEKLAVVQRLNHLRAQHGLDPVSYDPTWDSHVQRAAYIAVRNNILDHDPPSSYVCWSSEGARGSDESNLWGAWASHSDGTEPEAPRSSELIDDWLRDSAVANAGHRRWLLNPFLKTISFGRTDIIPQPGMLRSGGALRVFDNDREYGAISTNVSGVAFPQGDYPASACDIDGVHSFSMLIDKSDFWANTGIDYSTASVEVTSNGYVKFPVREISYDADGIGLPNCLMWKVLMIQKNVRYTVTITGVKVAGTVASPFTYWFRVVE